jgi:hypothetical protein
MAVRIAEFFPVPKVLIAELSVAELSIAEFRIRVIRRGATRPSAPGAPDSAHPTALGFAIALRRLRA